MMTKIKFSSLYLSLLALLSCRPSQSKDELNAETGMFKIAILYPNGEGKTFDLDYYETTHMPLVAGFLGENLKFYEIDNGVAGRTQDDEVPFVAIGYFYCYDVNEYTKAISRNIDTIINDIKNYTNIQPIVQISEIRQLRSNVKK